MEFEFNVEISPLLKDILIITPNKNHDLRGDIWTSYTAEKFNTFLPKNLKFEHDKFSTSKENVLRGIHGDNKTWKLVTAVHGEILQVIVDLRKSSPTFKKWDAFTINSKDQKIILIPPYFGNAYYVKSDSAVYHYKLAYDGDYFDQDQQFSYMWNDPTISIDWPCKTPILSNRDMGIV